jgi:hypothetical protein
MYAEVRFQLKRGNPPLVVPASTIVVRADGPQVGVVEGRLVHFRPRDVGADYGSEVELLSGVPDSAELVPNPSDDIIEGDHFRVAPAFHRRLTDTGDCGHRRKSNRRRRLQTLAGRCAEW